MQNNMGKREIKGQYPVIVTVGNLKKKKEFCFHLRFLPHYFLFFFHLFPNLLQFFDQLDICAIHPGVYHINRHGQTQPT